MKPDMLLIIAVVVGCAFLVAMMAMVVARQEKERKANIEARRILWGDSVVSALLQKKIAPGMTEEMVRLSWGLPNNIDKKEITKSGLNKERWVYGQPRKGARYIYFSEGEVQKIQT